jgi:hypothetical protein
MRVVLGGIPDTDDIVGRDQQVSHVLASFHGHGALLTGDRRHGKTSLTRLVEAASRDAGHHVVRLSAERTGFADFVDALADEFAASHSTLKRELKRWRLSLRAGPMTAERAPTTRSLDSLIRTAMRAMPDGLVVLSLDEIPVLAKSMESERRGSGGELLHLLRRLRQEHSGRLVMVLSGSIGFHHVTEDALGTVNDIAKLAVGPLQPTDAVFLARCLLLGESVASDNEHAVGVAIAEAAEHVPYYVHHLVKSARDLAQRSARVVTACDIPVLVDAALTDPDDPWDLRHYRDRIPHYYGDAADIVSEILDVYATAAGPLTVDQVKPLLDLTLRDEPERPSRAAVIRLLERLEADHYLDRDGDRDRFSSALVRRAWLAHRRR